MADIIAYFSSDVQNARDTAELYESKISRLVSQKAKCYITQQPLIKGEIATHHIVPVSKGGTDEYENVIIIQSQVHDIIHYSENLEVAIDKLNAEYETNEKMIKKFTQIYNKSKL